MSALRITSKTLLRGQLRPVARVAAPLLRRTEARSVGHVRGADDLGGPGGQKPVPSKPGGPEALKRNWVPIGGGALLLLAAISYMSSGDKPLKSTEADVKAATSEEVDALPKSSSSLAKRLEDKEVQALKEMSGRKGGGTMGSFRSE
ncbi:hypothetical protein AK830_g7747 [Neonectria ditissima]|uniref:Uncharacterized protein n=1 Tax=Neonectria ditissima TaxID=78410 RepID=A0A0N8H6F7_9HYPO|nr:hypothetical protein AK830_g7747 [Neonectria ditissima]